MIAVLELWLYTQFGFVVAVGFTIGGLWAFALGLHRWNTRVAPRLAYIDTITRRHQP